MGRADTRACFGVPWIYCCDLLLSTQGQQASSMVQRDSQQLTHFKGNTGVFPDPRFQRADGLAFLFDPMLPQPDSAPDPSWDAMSRLPVRFAEMLALKQACAEADPPIPLRSHQHRPQAGCSAKPDGIFTLGHRVDRAQGTDRLQRG